jgi:hypothetical protein
MAKKKTKEKEKKFYGVKKKNWIIGIVVGIVLLLLILFLFVFQFPYTSRTCNQANLKYVDTLYPATTTCIEWNNCLQWEDYCAERALGFLWCTRTETRCIDWGCSATKAYCNLEIKNIDDTAGTWGATMNIIGWRTETQSFSERIDPTFSKTFTIEYIMGSMNEPVTCSYTITSIPTKTVGDYVTRYKTLTQTERQDSC